MKETYTAFCQLPGINPALLPKSDLLHDMYLDITKHVLGWLYQFLKLYKRVDRFDNAWYSMASYPGFQPFRLSYTQTSS